jgi:arginine/lysine/ornithine decarboxylase
MEKRPVAKPPRQITMYEFKKLAGAVRYLNLEAAYPDGMEKCVHGVQLDICNGRVRARFMVNFASAIDHLMKHNNWSRQDAIEWFHTNIEGDSQQVLWVSCSTDSECEDEDG